MGRVFTDVPRWQLSRIHSVVLCVETESAAYKWNSHGSTTESHNHSHDARILPIRVVDQARQDERAKIFLDFARFPVVRVVGADCVTETLVQLADLRYTQPGSGRGTFSLDVPVDCPTQGTSEADRAERR